MTISGQLTQTVDIGGTTFRVVTTVTGDGEVMVSPSAGILGAKPGELTTRTDNDTGVVTAEAGHGIETSDLVDVYWTGGARYGMTATVATNEITLDGGDGDNLPSLNEDVTLKVPETEAFVIEGDDCTAIAVYSDVAGRVRFSDSGGVEYTVTIAAGATDIWLDGSGVTNPIAGDSIIEVSFSHGSTSAQIMTAAAMYE